MSRSMWRPLAAATVAAALVTLAACGPSASSGGGGKTIKIGFGGPLTGESAEFGQSWLNGIKLGIAQHSFTHKLKGDTVKLMALDDAGDPQQGITVARRHIAAGVSAVLANMNSGVTLATEPVYHRAGIVQITESSNPTIATRGYGQLFQLTADDNLQGHAMASYAKGTLHVHEVAVFNDSDAFGQGVAQTFAREARSQGLQVLGDTALSPSSKDYTGALSSVLGRHPDGIYFGGNVTVGGMLCRQARAAGFTGPFLGPDQLFEKAFVSGCGRRVGRAFMTFQSPPYDSSPQLEAFARSYRERFGVDPGPFSIYGYNQVGFLLTAMDELGTTDPQKVAEKMHQMTYHSLFGPQRVDGTGRLVDAPLFIFKVVHGDYQLAGRVHDQAR